MCRLTMRPCSDPRIMTDVFMCVFICVCVSVSLWLDLKSGEWSGSVNWGAWNTVWGQITKGLKSHMKKHGYFHESKEDLFFFLLKYSWFIFFMHDHWTLRQNLFKRIRISRLEAFSRASCKITKISSTLYWMTLEIWKNFNLRKRLLLWAQLLFLLIINHEDPLSKPPIIYNVSISFRTFCDFLWNGNSDCLDSILTTYELCGYEQFP